MSAINIISNSAVSNTYIDAHLDFSIACINLDTKVKASKYYDIMFVFDNIVVMKNILLVSRQEIWGLPKCRFIGVCLLTKVLPNPWSWHTEHIHNFYISRWSVDIVVTVCVWSNQYVWINNSALLSYVEIC